MYCTQMVIALRQVTTVPGWICITVVLSTHVLSFAVIHANCARLVHGCTWTGAHCAWMDAHGTWMDICKIPIFTQFLHFSQLSTISTLSFVETFIYNRLWPWWSMKSSIQRFCNWNLSLEMKRMRLHLDWKSQTQI